MDELSLRMGLLSDKELEDYFSLQDLNHASSPPSSSIDGHTDIDALSVQKEHSDAPVLHENNVKEAADESIVRVNETTNGIAHGGPIFHVLGQVTFDSNLQFSSKLV